MLNSTSFSCPAHGNGTGGSPNEQKPPYEVYTLAMFLSAFLIVLQILITIFAPKMRDLPIRWHTLNYSCWNVYQLIVYSNCAENSGIKHYIQNSWIEENCDRVQLMTLSIFFCCKFLVFQSTVDRYEFSAMILQVPATIFLYFIPDLERTRLYRFYVWIPVHFFLDLGIFLVYSSYVRNAFEFIT